MVKDKLLIDFTTNILNAINEINIRTLNPPMDSQSGVFLFFSFDLSDSTVFKAEHPALWSSVFTNFYGELLRALGVENYMSVETMPDEELTGVRRLWKFIGDEVLVYVQIKDPAQLYKQIVNVNGILNGLMNEIASKVEDELKGKNFELAHNQKISDIINSTLGIKSTAWIAECHKNATEAVANIIYEPMTAAINSESRIDFLGKDVDEGFRIAKYAVKNKIIISPLLGWLIWKHSTMDIDTEKIVDSNFKITSFVKMKGVWRNRKVPIIMYHNQFENFEDVLSYDEIDLETYENIKNAGFDDFKSDKLYKIQRIKSIFKDIHRENEAITLYDKICNSNDVEILTTKIENKQELHIACVIFDSNGNILIHQDHERGLEFGCVKKFLGFGYDSWRLVCKDGYKERYNIDIDLEENPVPIATYYYGNSNAFGIIVIANYVGENAKQESDWKFCTPEELINYNGKTVDSFKENVQKALAIRAVKKNLRG